MMNWLAINLKPFNPTSLQNVVLGILTFFIPFAIVFLTDVLNDKNNNKSTFDRMCLNNEVLKTKPVFIVSIIGIILFGFGDQTAHIWFKLVAIIFSIVLFGFLYCVFINLLNYSNNQLIFKIQYLNRLKDNVKLNKQNNEELIDAWQSIWSSELKQEEEIEFTKIFFKMFDECFTHNNQNKLLAQLRNIYNHNGQYRIYYTDQISTFLLPKIFKWRCQNRSNILATYPSSINVENLINKLSKETDYFYEMQQIFLFFDEKFKENIKSKEKSAQLEANILKDMLHPYLKTFFENIMIDNVDAVMNLMPFDFYKNKIINHYFLEEFLIFIKNKKCLNLNNENEKGFSITQKIISIIFKCSDEKLITSFLKLYFINNYFQTSSDLLYIGFVLKQLFNLNNIKFYTEKNTPIASFYDRTKTDEEIDKQEFEKNKKIKEYQKKQAAKYIFNYFGYYILTNFDGIFYINNDKNKDNFNFNLQKKGIYCIDKFKSDLEQFNSKLESYELEYVSDSIKYKDIITDLKELITVLLENLQDPSIFDLEIDD